MNTHVNFRAAAALTGGCAVVGIGLLGLSVGSQKVPPGGDAVLAPATDVGQTLDQVATTSTAASWSFRPLLTATPPPPPID